jgi:hypothetical protein
LPPFALAIVALEMSNEPGQSSLCPTVPSRFQLCQVHEIGVNLRQSCMWRIPFLAIAICLSLQASSTVFYSCSVGTTTATPCPETDFFLEHGLSNPPYNNAHATAFAQVLEPTLEEITVEASSDVLYDACTGCPQPPLSATAEAIVNDLDSTAGPVRSGFIEIGLGILTHPAVTTTSWNISDGIHSYIFSVIGCPGAEGCYRSETLPFELGVPFIVNAVAIESVSITASDNKGIIAVDEVSSTFRPLEADRKTPVAVFAIPEPSTCALLLIGTGLLPVLVRARSVVAVAMNAPSDAPR